MKRLSVRMGGAILAAALAWSSTSADDGVIPPAAQASVRAAVDDGGRPGVVIGYLRDGETAFYSYGSTAVEDGAPIGPDSIFEVGSVTKVFTTEILAALTVAGEVNLDTTLAEIWPERRFGGKTTLVDLATHRSGLPRDIPDLALANDDEAALLAALDTASATTDVAYSNAGMAILARALAARTGQSPAMLVERLISGPMNLASTGYEPADVNRLAHPHVGRSDIGATRPRTVGIARGAGGLHTTARDLLAFLEHQLHPRPGRPAETVRLSLSGADGLPLGWQVHQQGDRRIFHHSGEADGYQAFVGFHHEDGGVAVVLLTNSSKQDDLQSIALHLLDPSVPLPVFEAGPADQEGGALGRFAGVYLIEGQEQGNRLEFVDLGGELGYVETDPDGRVIRRSRLEEASPGEFRLRGAPVRVVFEEAGRARLLIGEQTVTLILQD